MTDDFRNSMRWYFEIEKIVDDVARLSAEDAELREVRDHLYAAMAILYDRAAEDPL